MSALNDAYSILEISPSATRAEIRRAYHRLALLTHPDKLPPSASAAARASSEERFKLVASAYEVLIDPEKRAKYARIIPRFISVTFCAGTMPAAFLRLSAGWVLLVSVRAETHSARFSATGTMMLLPPQVKV
jgi:preprotein translocase subunit Sec63